MKTSFPLFLSVRFTAQTLASCRVVELYIKMYALLYNRLLISVTFLYQSTVLYLLMSGADEYNHVMLCAMCVGWAQKKGIHVRGIL